MSRVSFEHVAISETKEPMVCLGAMPFICVPVYHHNGWTKSPDMFLRKGLADRLLHIQNEHLEPAGLQLVIYDAFRSRETQAAIYQHYWHKFSHENPAWKIDRLTEHASTFVTIPDQAGRVPPHTSGGSVDLGLFNMRTGRAVNLGPDFDEFVPEVAFDAYEKPGMDVNVRDGRRYMNSLLADVGIAGDVDEYFHKDYGNQKWAAHLNLTAISYGEVVDCRLQPDGSVKTIYLGDLTPDAQQARLASLKTNLDLSHPVMSPAPKLPVPAQLVEKAWIAKNKMPSSRPGGVLSSRGL